MLAKIDALGPSNVSHHTALSLAKECYSMKLDLLTNATVVDDAIRFVSFKDKSSISIEPELEKEKHKVDDAVTVDKKHSNDI